MPENLSIKKYKILPLISKFLSSPLEVTRCFDGVGTFTSFGGTIDFGTQSILSHIWHIFLSSSYFTVSVSSVSVQMMLEMRDTWRVTTGERKEPAVNADGEMIKNEHMYENGEGGTVWRVYRQDDHLNSTSIIMQN